MRYAVKPMDIGEILDQSILLLRNHYKLFLAIAAFAYIPCNLIAKVALVALLPQDQEVAPTTVEEQWALVEAMLPGLAVGLGTYLIMLLIVQPITMAALIRAISDEYLEQPVTARKALKDALPVTLPLILTSIVKYVAICVGFCFCFIPGIYLYLRYSFTANVIVVENTYYLDAMKRSWNLMEFKGHMLSAFVLYFLIWIIVGFMTATGAIIPFPVISIPLQVMSEVMGLIFTVAVSVVFYFSCRCNVENFDLALLAQAVGAGDYQEQANYQQGQFAYQNYPPQHEQPYQQPPTPAPGDYMQGPYYQQYPEGLPAQPAMPPNAPLAGPPYPPPPEDYIPPQWQQQGQPGSGGYPPPPPAPPPPSPGR